ncbi:hypothetical protein [Moritella sp. F3]|uniref:hypothetical protein n=1 Tax=Moritella sp. F3 TaxID=2718882 RepID=UPI0018E124AD|nr:hypothetical protein [Moritella sp. F3]GIC77876.1 hypothetical protein FMO001_26030 [Moritella sp. F1]GIC82435.1 hypothetical protein FMO003_27160 [Moritella sp. F3]
MAEGLQKSESMIGLTVTFYAWIGANFDFTVLMSFSGTAIVISLFMISIIPSNINEVPSQLVGDNL